MEIDFFKIFVSTAIAGLGFFVYLYGKYGKEQLLKEWNSISCKPKASLPVCEECGRVQEEFGE